MLAKGASRGGSVLSRNWVFFGAGSEEERSKTPAQNQPHRIDYPTAMILLASLDLY